MYIYRFCQICDLNNCKKNNTSWICSKLCNNHKRIIMHTLIFTWQHQFTYNNTTPNSWKIDIFIEMNYEPVSAQIDPSHLEWTDWFVTWKLIIAPQICCIVFISWLWLLRKFEQFILSILPDSTNNISSELSLSDSNYLIPLNKIPVMQ